MTSALMQVVVNGGAPQTGAVTVAASNTVAPSGINTSGWRSVIWEIYSYPPGFNPGGGWVLGSDGYTWQHTSQTPDPFSVGTAWGKWLLRSRINGNPLRDNPDGTPQAFFIPSNTDESTALIFNSSHGLEDVGAGEANQFSILGWVKAIQDDLRILDSLIGTGGGTNGVNAFTTTTANFTQPAVGSNVTVAVGATSWMGINQPIFVGPSGGTYQVVSITDAIHVVLKNLGYTGNASPSSTVISGSTVSAGGLQGAAGTATNGANAYTTTGANFTQPNSGSNVTVTVGSTGWMAAGEPLYVATGGTYQVVSITDAIHVVLKNLGYTGNVAPTTVVSTGSLVTPTGFQGPSGGGGGGGSFATIRTAAPVTLTAFQRVLCDVHLGGFTVTAPATPSDFDMISVKDAFGDASITANNITVSGNGHNIEDPNNLGVFAASVVMSDRGGTTDWEYDATNTRWVVV